jgi:integrase/recombinase XerD
MGHTHRSSRRARTGDAVAAREKGAPSRCKLGEAREERGFESLGHKYLAMLRTRGYAVPSVREHEYMLCRFIAWCRERGVERPSEVTRPVLESYQRTLFHYRKAKTGDPLSLRTQNRRVWPLCTFFRWLTKNNFLLQNPAVDIVLPKRERRLPRCVLTASEAEKVLAVPDVRTKLGLRDRAMLEVFYATGVRRNELVNLRLEDLDIEREMLWVRQGKGRNDRVVPIGERALAWVRKYVEEARPDLVRDPEERTLFLNQRGGRWSGNLTGRIARYVAAADIGKKGGCHAFRHTAATVMLEGGADTRYVQEMLGHAQLTSTQIYTRVSPQRLKEVHSATHPGARLVPRSKRATAAAKAAAVPATTYEHRVADERGERDRELAELRRLLEASETGSDDE